MLCCFPGSPPGHREEPYLAEAGRDAFDRFCRLRQGALQVLGGGLPHAPAPVQVEEPELVKDVLNILIGVVSATFSLCQVRRTCRWWPALRQVWLEPCALQGLCTPPLRLSAVAAFQCWSLRGVDGLFECPVF